MKTLLIAAFALILSAAAPASASDFANGSTAYKSGAYALAISYWKPLAEKGNAAAQYNIGRMYFYGQGVSPNMIDAYKWFTLAARQGFGKAGIAVVAAAKRLTDAQRHEAEFSANLVSASARF